jgi:hypothetical protein
MTRASLSAGLALIAITSAASPFAVQAQLKAGASTRATTEVSLATPRVEGQPAPTPVKIRIDYGQPHARGRAVAGALAADLGKVWRLGANEATEFKTDVDVEIGGVRVPKGTYSLFVETAQSGWKLIVSKRTGTWGTEYDPAADLARIPVKSRTLASPLESFTMWLIPTPDTASGELRFGWGTMEFSVPWAVRP